MSAALAPSADVCTDCSGCPRCCLVCECCDGWELIGEIEIGLGLCRDCRLACAGCCEYRADCVCGNRAATSAATRATARRTAYEDDDGHTAGCLCSTCCDDVGNDCRDEDGETEADLCEVLS